MTPPPKKIYISPPPTRPYFFLVISDTHTCHNQLKLASFQFFSRLSKNKAKFGILIEQTLKQVTLYVLLKPLGPIMQLLSSIESKM